MRPEEKEKLNQGKTPQEPAQPDPAIIRESLKANIKRRPVHFPIVTPTTTSTDEGDRQATLNLLEGCRIVGGYLCPRCDFSTPHIEGMVAHLAEEINKSVQAIANMHKQPDDVENSPGE